VLGRSRLFRRFLHAHSGRSLRASTDIVQILLNSMDYKNTKTIDLLANIAGEHEAFALMERYPSLTDMARAEEFELQQMPGIGAAKAAAVKSALSLAVKLTQEVSRSMPLMDTPERIADLLREEMRIQRVETFYVVLLNTRRKLIQSLLISQGTLDTLLVSPREVFFPAIRENASAIILAHSHPSGDISPSSSDISATRDLIRAGQILKIEVLDHVIIGARTTDRPCDFLSLREAGYFYD
jgi:DNA repair protein RadC